MSKKNTLENKRLRKARKQKDHGYPNFYEQTKVVSEDAMTMDKYMRLGFYSNILNTLGLAKGGADADTTTN